MNSIEFVPGEASFTAAPAPNLLLGRARSVGGVLALNDSRVDRVRELGFTERQARFLVVVMRHSGVCMLRQYTAYAGVVHGQKTRAFFSRLVIRKFVDTYECEHQRARIYHVRHKALYRALGEPDHRHRRPVPLSRAIERLMLLDALLANPDLVWLATEKEKASHCSMLTSLSAKELPHSTIVKGAERVLQPFPDDLPIGIDLGGRAVLVYLVVGPDTDGFRAFLHRHRTLLGALRAWTLRLVLAPDRRACRAPYEAVVREELQPLSRLTLEELRWYFGYLREQARSGPDDPTVRRLERARRAFASPRFRMLYRAWKREGESTLDTGCSLLLGDAVARGVGRIEYEVLPHSYGHLSLLAGTS